jgi:hypothetical protein
MSQSYKDSQKQNKQLDITPLITSSYPEKLEVDGSRLKVGKRA